MLDGMIFTQVHYQDSLSQKSYDTLVGKMIKATAVRKLLVIDEGYSLTKIEKSIKLKKLNDVGTYLLYCGKAVYLAGIEGALVLVESGLEWADSQGEFEFLAMNKVLSLISVRFNGLKGEITPEIVTGYLRTQYPDGEVSNSYSLINLHDNSRVIVGNIATLLCINDTIYYPGNNTLKSAEAPNTIFLSIANGTSEPNTSYKNPKFATYYEGARYAVQRSNFYKETSRFQLNLFPTDCGNFFYNPAWSENCLSKVLENLGVAYLTSYTFQAADGNYNTLRNLGTNIPQISPSAMTDLDQPTADFPNLLKLSTSVVNDLNSGGIFLKALGWKSLVILTVEGSAFFSFFDLTVFGAPTLGLKVENPVDKRILSKGYTREDFEANKHIFQAAKDTRCRSFLIYYEDTGVILEGLYDVGLRKGDIFILEAPLLLPVFADIEEKYLVKRKELSFGMLSLKFNEWYNETWRAIVYRNVCFIP